MMEDKTSYNLEQPVKEAAELGVQEFEKTSWLLFKMIIYACLAYIASI
jgi:hypothetical protein